MGMAESPSEQSKGRTGVAIGKHVRQARERLGLDLIKLSERLLAVGHSIPKSALSRLENGQRRVDVDDLMALAVVLYVSPLELLLGDVDNVITPTGMPDGFHGEEVWAWASGEVELDPGEIADWWRSQISAAQARLEAYVALRDDETLSDRARRQLESNIREAQNVHRLAVDRIRVHTGEGEMASVMWEAIPPDPTAEVRFGDGQHQAEA